LNSRVVHKITIVRMASTAFTSFEGDLCADAFCSAFPDWSFGRDLRLADQVYALSRIMTNNHLKYRHKQTLCIS
jgi:hypothetical protein